MKQTGVIESCDRTPEGRMTVKGQDGKMYEVKKLGCANNCEFLARLQPGKELRFEVNDDGVIDCFKLAQCERPALD